MTKAKAPWDGEDDPELSRRAPSHHMSTVSKALLAAENQGDVITRRTWSVLLAFTMEKGAHKPRKAVALEAGKGKEAGFPFERPERNAACWNLDFSPLRPMLDF